MSARSRRAVVLGSVAMSLPLDRCTLHSGPFPIIATRPVLVQPDPHPRTEANSDLGAMLEVIKAAGLRLHARAGRQTRSSRRLVTYPCCYLTGYLPTWRTLTAFKAQNLAITQFGGPLDLSLDKTAYSPVLPKRGAE